MKNIAITGLHEALSFQTMEREMYLVVSNLDTRRNMLLPVTDEIVVELLALADEEQEQGMEDHQESVLDGAALPHEVEPGFEF